MAQVLVRNLDDGLVEAYREAAVRNGRSLEAELREVLQRFRPRTQREREEAFEAARKIRAMTPEGVKQTPSEELVRADRDGDRWP